MSGGDGAAGASEEEGWRRAGGGLEGGWRGAGRPLFARVSAQHSRGALEAQNRALHHSDLNEKSIKSGRRRYFTALLIGTHDWCGS